MHFCRSRVRPQDLPGSSTPAKPRLCLLRFMDGLGQDALAGAFGDTACRALLPSVLLSFGAKCQKRPRRAVYLLPTLSTAKRNQADEVLRALISACSVPSRTAASPLWVRQPGANRARLREDAHTSSQPRSQKLFGISKKENCHKNQCPVNTDQALSVTGHLEERGCKASFQALQGDALFFNIIIFFSLIKRQETNLAVDLRRSACP